MSGFKTVFAFTLRQQLRSRGWRITSAVICAALLLLPAVIMPCVEYFGGRSSMPEDPGPLVPCRVYCVGGGEEFKAVLAAFAASGAEGAENVGFIPSDSTLSAVASASDEKNALALSVAADGGDWRLEFVLPEGSELTEEQAQRIAEALQMCAYAVLGGGEDESAVEPEPEPEPEQPEGGESYDPFAGMRRILGMLLPYANIMAIYFLVLFYGQSVANCVIMEKTSRLMDTFLIAVRPGEMILGKVLAVWASSAVQVLLFIVSLCAGFGAGTALVCAVNPDTEMLLIKLFGLLGGVSGLLSPAGCVLAVLILFAGFLLYCTLAAVGGSLAGKPEDLQSSNMLFTLILVVSFFCALYGGMNGSDGFGWLDAAPFTAILVTPSRLLLGAVTPLMGAVSLLLILVFCGLAVLLAGRVYTMMALYKGEMPKPGQVIKMLRGKN